jgi:hypothetical protein
MISSASSFLTNARKRAVLQFLWKVICPTVAACWVFFHGTSEQPPRPVTAVNSSVAVGGDVVGNISIGPNEEQVRQAISDGQQPLKDIASEVEAFCQSILTANLHLDRDDGSSSRAIGEIVAQSSGTFSAPKVPGGADAPSLTGVNFAAPLGNNGLIDYHIAGATIPTTISSVGNNGILAPIQVATLSSDATTLSPLRNNGLIDYHIAGATIPTTISSVGNNEILAPIQIPTLSPDAITLSPLANNHGLLASTQVNNGQIDLNHIAGATIPTTLSPLGNNGLTIPTTISSVGNITSLAPTNFVSQPLGLTALSAPFAAPSLGAPPSLGCALCGLAHSEP